MVGRNVFYRRKHIEEKRARTAVPYTYTDPEFAGHAKYGPIYSYDNLGSSSRSPYNTGTIDLYEKVEREY